MLGPFFLSAVYWMLRLADLLVRIRMGIIDPSPGEQTDPNFAHYLALFNAIFLVNVSASFSCAASIADTTQLLVCCFRRYRSMESMGNLQVRYGKTSLDSTGFPHYNHA